MSVMNYRTAWYPYGGRLWRYAVAAFIGFAAVISVSADTCIVSGDTSRDAAVSAPSVLDDWFDSSAFFIVIKPLQRIFNSYPSGVIISFY